jgi:RsiW-degrading membrane proteinase PrsW (M82 family)
MVYLIINVILAAIPALLLLLYFYRKDKTKREPAGLILKTFALGILAVIPAGAAEFGTILLFSRISGIAGLLIRAFIVAALIEESSKFLVIKAYIYRKKEFDEVTDGIVYTATASLGFAFFESLLYSFGPPWVMILRGVTSVPLHAIASGIMGYYIGLAKQSGEFKPIKGLLYAVVIHGLYDFFLFTGSLLVVLIVPLLFFSWLWLRRLYDDAQKRDSTILPELRLNRE